jgi:Putative MetA-pathway of phenol degradation
MKRLTVMVLALAVLAGSAMATSFLGRSSTMNKQYQFFGWTNFGYNQTALNYNWASGKYEALAAAGQTKTTSCDLTLAFGLSKEFDIDVVAPLAMKQKGDAKSAGLGDLMVYVRYGVLQDPEKPLKVALLLGGNLPTADKSASPALGDRTADVALGFSLNTKKMGKFLGHLRAAYWFNGKVPDSENKVGDMFEYLLCGDYSVTKTLTPELALSGYLRDESQLGGTWIPKSDVSQHLLSVLLMWKPISALTIRPKVSFPLTVMSQGSTLANVYGGLDIWVTLP